MTKLYELTGQLAELAAMADTDDENLKQAIQDTMGAIEGEFAEKAEAIVMIMRNVESDVSAIDAEIGRLNELKRIKKNSVEQMRDYLRRNMEAGDLKTIKRPLFNITLAMGSERVVINDEKAIPDDYVNVVTSVSPDKKAIGARLKEIRAHNAEIQKRIDAGEDAAGELIAEPVWANLERGESSIRIK